MANETFKFGGTKWAVKENSILAYNDENNNFKPLPFNFTRASTATRVNEDGLIEVVKSGIPRIDYTDNPSGHLLLEPYRRNIVTYSEDFTTTTWTTLSNATLSTSSTICPDGSQNAVKVTNTSGSPVDLRTLATITSGITYTNSCYIRRVTGTGNIRLVGVNGVQSSPLAITSEWNRFEITATSVDVLGRFYVRVDSLNDEVEVWGAQLEDAGSGVGTTYATSYIPTDGTTVTRVAETCTGAGNAQVFNDSEGVLFANVAALANDGTFRMMSLSDSSTSDRIVLYFAGDSNKIYAFAASATTPTVDQNYLLSNVVDFNKIAFKYKTNDFSVYANGVEILTDTGGDAPIGLAEFAFDSGSLLYPFYGKIKQIGVYDTALTDTELENLTS